MKTAVAVYRLLLLAEGWFHLIWMWAIAWQRERIPGLAGGELGAAAAGYVILAAASSLWTAGRLKRRTRGARAWALGTAAANLPLIPLGTLTGLYGVVLFALPRTGRYLRAEAAEARRVRGGLLGQWAVGGAVAVLGLGGWQWIRRHSAQGDPPRADWADLAFALTLAPLMVTLAHELGHVIAGWMVGFRFGLISLGPFSLTRTGGRWRAAFRARQWWEGGLAGAAPRNGAWLRQKIMVLLAGGPLGSLVFALVCFELYLAAPGSAYARYAGGLATMALYAALAFAVSALPIEFGTMSTDGQRLRQLARGGQAADRITAAYAIAMATQAGTRPRKWDPAWIRTITSAPDGSLYHVDGCLDAYTYELDRGDVKSALAWLGAAHTAWPDGADDEDPQAQSMRAGLLIESAYVAAVLQKQPDQPREYLTEARRLRKTPAAQCQILRAEAAIQWAEAGHAGALLSLGELAKAVAALGPTGQAAFERDLLEYLRWLITSGEEREADIDFEDMELEEPSRAPGVE